MCRSALWKQRQLQQISKEYAIANSAKSSFSSEEEDDDENERIDVLLHI